MPAGMTLPSDVVAVGRPARVVRTASADDLARLARSARRRPLAPAADRDHRRTHTGDDRHGPALRRTAASCRPSPRRRSLFPTAEITGDVVVGERTIIGAGVKIIGDSHGPVRIGNDVQILENTVLHLLPDNDLIIDDGVIVGPGAMIHGCRIGAGSVVEPGRDRLRRQRARRRLRRARRRGRQAALALRRRHRDRRLPGRRGRTHRRAAPDADLGAATRRPSRPRTWRSGPVKTLRHVVLPACLGARLGPRPLRRRRWIELHRRRPHRRGRSCGRRARCRSRIRRRSPSPSGRLLRRGPPSRPGDGRGQGSLRARLASFPPVAHRRVSRRELPHVTLRARSN